MSLFLIILSLIVLTQLKMNKYIFGQLNMKKSIFIIIILSMSEVKILYMAEYLTPPRTARISGLKS